MLLHWQLATRGDVAICLESHLILKAIRRGSAVDSDVMRMLDSRAVEITLMWNYTLVSVQPNSFISIKYVM